MQLLSRGVLTDYDPESGLFHVQDVAHPAIQGATPNVERVYDLVTALQADGPDADEQPGPYRDSGDKDPHA